MAKFFSQGKKRHSRPRLCLRCSHPLSDKEQWRNQCDLCGARLLLTPEQRQLPAPDHLPVLPTPEEPQGQLTAGFTAQPCLVCGGPLAVIDQWRNTCPHCGARFVLQPATEQLPPVRPTPSATPAVAPVAAAALHKANGHRPPAAAPMLATGVQPTPADPVMLFSTPDPAYAPPEVEGRGTRVRRLFDRRNRPPARPDDAATGAAGH